MKAALSRAIEVRERFPLQQFGQAHDWSTWDGKTGCAHTTLQSLVKMWTGRDVTPDDISRVALYPWPSKNPGRRGLRADEVFRVFRKYGLPYSLAVGMTVEQLLRASNKAPVLFGVRYGDYPLAKGIRPPWRAVPPYAEEHGATQRYGFDGAHMAMLLGYEPHVVNGKTTHYDAYVFEPNHNSGRIENPRRPAYDVITTQQLRRAFESIKSLPVWTRTYAFVPTRSLPIPTKGN